MIAYGECKMDVLLDEKDGQSRVLERPKRPEQLIRDDRRGGLRRPRP